MLLYPFIRQFRFTIRNLYYYMNSCSAVAVGAFLLHTPHSWIWNAEKCITRRRTLKKPRVVNLPNSSNYVICMTELTRKIVETAHNLNVSPLKASKNRKEKDEWIRWNLSARYCDGSACLSIGLIHSLDILARISCSLNKVRTAEIPSGHTRGSRIVSAVTNELRAFWLWVLLYNY